MIVNLERFGFDKKGEKQKNNCYYGLEKSIIEKEVFFSKQKQSSRKVLKTIENFF